MGAAHSQYAYRKAAGAKSSLKLGHLYYAHRAAFFLLWRQECLSAEDSRGGPPLACIGLQQPDKSAFDLLKLLLWDIRDHSVQSASGAGVRTSTCWQMALPLPLLAALASSGEAYPQAQLPVPDGQAELWLPRSSEGATRCSRSWDVQQTPAATWCCAMPWLCSCG